MRREYRELVSLAKEEADRMQAIAGQAKAGDSISMEVEQFTKLAEIITTLCHLGDEDVDYDLGSPRYWVPLDIFKKLQEKCNSLECGSSLKTDTFIIR